MKEVKKMRNSNKTLTVAFYFCILGIIAVILFIAMNSSVRKTKHSLREKIEKRDAATTEIIVTAEK